MPLASSTSWNIRRNTFLYMPGSLSRLIEMDCLAKINVDGWWDRGRISSNIAWDTCNKSTGIIVFQNVAFVVAWEVQHVYLTKSIRNRDTWSVIKQQQLNSWSGMMTLHTAVVVRNNGRFDVDDLWDCFAFDIRSTALMLLRHNLHPLVRGFILSSDEYRDKIH